VKALLAAGSAEGALGRDRGENKVGIGLIQVIFFLCLLWRSGFFGGKMWETVGFG
jgi:hypothetical protein